MSDALGGDPLSDRRSWCWCVGAAGQGILAEAEAKAAFERGRAAHNAGKTDEAVSAFERAVALDPTSSLYHLWLGHAYSRQLRTAGFLRQPFIARRSGEAYHMAVKLDPTSIDAAEGRLEFLLGAPGIVGGGVDKARAEAARIATLDAYRGAMAEARIAEHEKEWPKAERLYRSLMADYPDRTAAVDALLTILQNAKRFDEAFKIVDDRLARLPDESSSLYNLGRLSAVSGQHLARGESAMRRFLAINRRRSGASVQRALPSGHDQGKDGGRAGGGNRVSGRARLISAS